MWSFMQVLQLEITQVPRVSSRKSLSRSTEIKSKLGIPDKPTKKESLSIEESAIHKQNRIYGRKFIPRVNTQQLIPKCFISYQDQSQFENIYIDTRIGKYQLRYISKNTERVVIICNELLLTLVRGTPNYFMYSNSGYN